MVEPAATSEPARGAGGLERIRNVCVVAHINAGKTTLVERMLFDSGRQRYCGDVDAGTTTMDWLPEEQSRGISIGAGVSRIDWRGHRVHLVDTPGHVDFGAEVARVLRVIEGAVVVVDGIRGVEPQTESVWRALDAAELPRLVFVNKLDRETADFAAALASLERAFPGWAWLPTVVPLPGRRTPVGGLGDAVGGGAVGWELDPDAGTNVLQTWRDRLVDLVADLDASVLAAAVDHDAVDPRLLARAIRDVVRARRAVPVLCGSALSNRGVDALLDAVCRYLPPPSAERPEDIVGGLVFQGAEFDGRYEGLVRLMSGTIRAGDRLEVVGAGVQPFAVEQIAEPHGASRHPVDRAGAGDLIAIVSAVPLAVGSTVRSPGASVVLDAPRLERPVLQAAIEPDAADDVRELEAAARRLAALDPSLAVQSDPTTGALTIAGMGELHLEVFAERLRRALGRPFRVGRPQVRERLTVAGAAVGHADCQRRLGDRVLAAVAEVAVEPAPIDDEPRVRWAVPVFRGGDEAARELADHLVRAAREGPSGTGPLAGLVLEVRRADAVHGEEAADILLREALELAARRAVESAEPVRLKPWVGILVATPAAASVGVLADLRSRHADIRAVRSGLDTVEIEAAVDLQLLIGWTTRLRSMTQGRGRFEQWSEGLRRAAGELA